MAGLGLTTTQQTGLGLSQNQPQGPFAALAGTSDTGPVSPQDLAAIAQQYPRLAPHLANSRVQWGIGPPDYQSEFYQPWDKSNPNTGKATIELYNRNLSREQRKQYVPAELLHHLGAVNPETGEAVDPAWLALKQKFLASRTPEQMKADLAAYKAENDPRPFKDWLAESRGDAYLRAAAFPEINPGWDKFLTPEQKQMARTLQSYLKAAK